MKSLWFTFFAIVLLFSCSGDNESKTNEENPFIGGVFEGGITLTNQEEVNAFAARGHTGVSASLFLIGQRNDDPITDISALSTLTFIGGSIRIQRTALRSLDGFQNLTSIGGDVLVCTCPTGGDTCASCSSAIIDYCAIRTALQNNENTDLDIRSFLFSPTREDIISGNCSL